MVGGTKFYQRAEIKDLLAYLRVTMNATDDLSLLRVINTPRRGLGDVAIGRLQGYAAENAMPLREALLRAGEVAGFTAGAAQACVRPGGELRLLGRGGGAGRGGRHGSRTAAPPIQAASAASAA